MPRPYLVPSRLEEVIYLIQFLGLRESFSLTNANKSVRRPISAASWAEVCADHPEFFEVTTDKSVYLSVRYHLGEAGKLKPIGLAVAQELIKNAFQLHEHQFKADLDENERKVQKWKNFREWLTFAGALIAGAAGAVQFIRNLM